MKEIEQDPSGYRVQRPDGSWAYRVNKPMCRWGGIVALVFCGYMGLRFWAEGGDPWIVVGPVMLAFAAGALITMSLKSLDW